MTSNLPSVNLVNMPVKERKIKILLLLFFLPENFYDEIEIDQQAQKIFNLSINYKTKGTLAGLIKSGLIIKKQAVDKIIYSLTEKGYAALCLEFPFCRFLINDWDGIWRIISYEIPERKREMRDRLRREMRGWGLGPWHRSFWLTSHPIIEDLRNLVYGREEEKYIQAFESTHIFGNLNELVEKVWDKSGLDKKYRQLLAQWHVVLSSEKSNLEKISQITASYIDILRFDPGLPKALVFQKWIGFEAWSLFAAIKKILLRKQ